MNKPKAKRFLLNLNEDEISTLYNCLGDYLEAWKALEERQNNSTKVVLFKIGAIKEKVKKQIRGKK